MPSFLKERLKQKKSSGQRKSQKILSLGNGSTDNYYSEESESGDESHIEAGSKGSTMASSTLIIIKSISSQSSRSKKSTITSERVAVPEICSLKDTNTAINFKKITPKQAKVAVISTATLQR